MRWLFFVVLWPATAGADIAVARPGAETDSSCLTDNQRFLFWSVYDPDQNRSQLMQAPKPGGPARQLSVLDGRVDALTAGESSLYALVQRDNADIGHVVRPRDIVALDNGRQRVIAASQPISLTELYLAADDRSVYWFSRGKLSHVPKNGGPVSSLVSGFPEEAQGLVVERGRLYFAGGGELWAASASGGGRRLAGGESWDFFGRIAVDHGRIFVADLGEKRGRTRDNGRVYLYDPSDGLILPIAVGLSGPQNLSLAGGRVYWSTSDGHIQSVGERGGAIVTIADTRDRGVELIADQDGVYWLDNGRLKNARGPDSAGQLGHAPL